MGSCIICGTSTDGHICDIHEEDAVFEFEGTRADQLTPGRFYKGSVDGFADFGVFVDIGDHVTGLLHRSELNRRLESLDWESGDTVYVQVTGVHDNGNVDLAWSIRQADDEFRGQLVDAPDGDRLADDTDTETGVVREGEAGNGRRAAEDRETAIGAGAGAGGSAGDADLEDSVATSATDTNGSASASASASASTGSSSSSSDTGAAERDASEGSEPRSASTGTEPAAGANANTNVGAGASATAVSQEPTFERSAIETLGERIGDTVRIEGAVVDVYQTGGPTIFEIRDESASVECAAFEEAGVRAYPAVEIGDVVRLDGTVEKRNGDLQVETAALAILDEEERETVEGRLDDALGARAEIDEVPLLAEGAGLDAFEEDVGAIATAIRRAVFDARPVLIKHSATAEGYAAGAAIERAVLPLVRDEHAGNDAAYHYVDRRPLGDEYDMNEATGDVTRMLTNRERHGEKLPLMVFADVGGTRESRDGFDLLSIYDVPRVVIDAGADPEVAEAVDALVGTLEGDGEADDGGEIGADEPTSGTLAAAVALATNPEVEADLAHVPAVSYRGANADAVPDVYAEAASEAGYDEGTIRSIGDALTLVAYYQSYEDKRELVADLLFDRADLAEPIAERYREELETELDTAAANTEERAIDGVSFAVLDTAAFTHGYDFPPVGVLLDELHRRRIADDDTREDGEGAVPTVTVGLGEDELRYRSTHPIDDHAVVAAAREEAPDAGLSVRGGSDARFEFLLGEREAVSEALLDAIADELSE